MGFALDSGVDFVIGFVCKVAVAVKTALGADFTIDVVIGFGIGSVYDP